MPNKVDVAYDIICSMFQLEVPDGEYAVRRSLTDEEASLKSTAVDVLNEFLKKPTPRPRRRNRPKPKSDGDNRKKVRA